MALLVDVILLVAAAVLALPTAVLAIEVLASVAARRRPAETPPAGQESRPRLAVVIPAHNEQSVLGRTLESLAPQLREGDRVLVVADNCNDGTAAVARECGAVCIERHDRMHRGKGYALDAGVKALASDPPQIVIFTDADVVVGARALETLAQQVERTACPAQAEYLMDAPARARSVDLVSRFAFTLKNKVRPLGLWRLGLPCPLFGAGMAFPWQTISTAPLATGDIVEDMRLGIDLARRGQAPLFCPDAEFRGVFPGDAADAHAQRRRWEHGHLSVWRDVPRLLLGGLRRMDGRGVALALDHVVQPLTVLCAELLIVLAAAVVWWLTVGGALSAAAAVVAGACVLMMGLSLGVAWAFHMRRQIPPKALLGLPRYVFVRAGNQASWLFRRQRDWVRTPRSQERDLNGNGGAGNPGTGAADGVTAAGAHPEDPPTHTVNPTRPEGTATTSEESPSHRPKLVGARD